VLATVWDQAWCFIPRDDELAGFDQKAGFSCQVSAPRGVIAREGSF
jgi:hypothetical protein